jgi:hypothetical protein
MNHGTTDSGQTWTRHELPGLPPDNEMRVHAIAVDPNDPQLLEPFRTSRPAPHGARRHRLTPGLGQGMDCFRPLLRG